MRFIHIFARVHGIPGTTAPRQKCMTRYRTRDHLPMHVSDPSGMLFRGAATGESQNPISRDACCIPGETATDEICATAHRLRRPQAMTIGWMLLSWF